METKQRDITVSQSRNINDPQWAILAGVRFFLALLVVVAHSGAVPGAGQKILEDLGGWNAVLGFFVISGFSIASSIERRPTGFYQRRLWRIGPVFLVSFVFAMIPSWSWLWHGDAPDPAPDTISLILNGLGLQTLFTAPVFAFAPSWSLFCEECYYYLAPFIKRQSTKILLVALCVSVFCYLNHAVFGTQDYFHEVYFVAPVCLAWAWLSGFLYFRHSEQEWAKVGLVGITSALAICNPFTPNKLGSVTMVAVCIALIYASRISVGDKLRSVLIWLGDVSFPLYLTHHVSLVLVDHAAPNLLRNNVFAEITASLMVATVVLLCVDYPMRRVAIWFQSRLVASKVGNPETVRAATVRPAITQIPPSERAS